MRGLPSASVNLAATERASLMSLRAAMLPCGNRCGSRVQRAGRGPQSQSHLDADRARKAKEIAAFRSPYESSGARDG
ncbi:hypothetical protein [Deinococcus frigens]|uniref:hypothetical protein n=1 Tax=Deinococcus frigens TaxID=249403 RepID=UPI0012EB4EE0|nr:hypothetical protein [Deinococcus frigens]